MRDNMDKKTLIKTIILLLLFAGAIFFLNWTAFAQPRRGGGFLGPIIRGTPLWWDGTRTDYILEDDLILEDIHPGLTLLCTDDRRAYTWYYHQGTLYPFGLWRGTDPYGLGFEIDALRYPLLFFDDSNNLSFPLNTAKSKRRSAHKRNLRGIKELNATGEMKRIATIFIILFWIVWVANFFSPFFWQIKVIEEEAFDLEAFYDTWPPQ